MPTIDALEVDRIPATGECDDDLSAGPCDDDDATEISQRSFLPYNAISPSLSSAGSGTGAGGTIRMEGWLNHATSTSSGGQAASKKAASKKKKRQTKQPRYFVLRGSTLSYYSRRHDVKAKGTFVLTTGCSVGPVLHSSLEDPHSAMEVAAPGADEEGEFPLSPSSSMSREGHYSALAATEQSGSGKSKKKKRKLYCVQVTWPINNKPSKDEKDMAQAKAQVAAESEKEALQQQQQQQQQQLEASSEYNAAANQNNDRIGSPVIKRPSLPRHICGQSGGGSPGKSHDGSATENLPSDFHPLNLNIDDARDNDIGQEAQYKQVSLAPKPRPSREGSSGSRSVSTPASAMLGMNAFQKPKIDNSNENSNRSNSNSASLNHETGLHKHYTQQIKKHAKDQQKATEELQKVMQLLSRKKSYQKTKKKVIQGTKVAAVSTAAITAGVLTAGIGLAAGLVFVGITAAAGGSGAVVGSKVLDKARGKYHAHRSQKCFHLIIAASTYEEAARWKEAMESVIRELVEEEEAGEEEWRIQNVPSAGCGEEKEREGPGKVPRTVGFIAPLSLQKKGAANGAPTNQNRNGTANEAIYHHATPRWVPIQGGGMALWGILGALGGGGGNLRVYREERPAMQPDPYFSYSSRAVPALPRFRSDVGLVGQPFPPLKASIALRSNTLDTFMCLMCSGRVPDASSSGDDTLQPNSGQIASFRIIETMDEHMDVIHLVFRPLYLFPSWTAPRDFVLYRFWKYDDDGTYQVCFDSGEHRDCPHVKGYVRGKMHSVYTIAPVKQRKKSRRRGAGATNAPAAGNAPPEPPYGSLSNEECLLSHVVQIDPRGWVPTTSSLPFLWNQGYGDAFAVMALHQMLDVKEALDSMRFVAVPMDSVANHHSNLQSNNLYVSQGGKRGRMPRRLLANGDSGNKACSARGRPPRGLVRDSSDGSKGRVGVSGNSGVSGSGQQQQQVYEPMLEAPDNGYITEEDELDAADYDFKYSGHEVEPRQSSSTNNKICVQIDIDNVNGEMVGHNHRSNEDNTRVPTSENIMNTPPPMIPEWWAEPDANSFRVRGKNYKNDHKKVNAGRSLFRLLAAEIIETDVPIMTGLCLHPKERVQLALQREAKAKSKGIKSSDMPPFVFVVNIVLPGPPNYHMMFYYAVENMSMIDGSDGTPSSKLCRQFFFESDDTFRDSTFKLIPQIIEGNFMVRKAVGSTPAIMGNKIKQTYVQGERFFELMIDTGSSAVAAGVIRICNGYAKMITVDLAFLLEGTSEQTLPERVLGCVRLKNAEFGKKLRFVESVDD